MLTISAAASTWRRPAMRNISLPTRRRREREGHPLASITFFRTHGKAGSCFPVFYSPYCASSVGVWIFALGSELFLWSTLIHRCRRARYSVGHNTLRNFSRKAVTKARRSVRRLWSIAIEDIAEVIKVPRQHFGNSGCVDLPEFVD